MFQFKPYKFSILTVKFASRIIKLLYKVKIPHHVCTLLIVNFTINSHHQNEQKYNTIPHNRFAQISNEPRA